MLRAAPNGRRTRSSVIGDATRPNDVRGWQIGPRIRVGGTLGKLGQEAKIGVGKLASNPIVDSALALIPGVGPGVSAAVNAAGHVLDTSHGGIHSAGDVARGALSAGEAYLGGKAANGARDWVTNHLLSSAGAAAANGANGGANGGDTGNGDADPSLNGATDTSNGDSSGGGGLLSAAKKVGGGVVNAFTGGGSPGGTSMADKALLAAAVAQSAADRKRQQGLQDQAVTYSTGAYNAKAPMRAQGQAMALNPTTPDLSNTFADPGNPYSTGGRTIGPKIPARQMTY